MVVRGLALQMAKRAPSMSCMSPPPSRGRGLMTRCPPAARTRGPRLVCAVVEVEPVSAKWVAHCHPSRVTMRGVGATVVKPAFRTCSVGKRADQLPRVPNLRGRAEMPGRAPDTMPTDAGSESARHRP